MSTISPITRDAVSALQGYRGYEGPAGTRGISTAVNLVKELNKEHWGGGLLRGLNQMGGIILHYPAVALDRLIRGFNAILEGKTARPQALLLGPPREKK